MYATNCIKTVSLALISNAEIRVGKNFAIKMEANSQITSVME